MIVTAWCNGGTGFGVKVAKSDRKRYFRKEWTSVTVFLGDAEHPVIVNVGKPSFWSPTCGELISAGIRQWLEEQGLVPWPPRCPPKLSLEPMGEGRFLLRRAQHSGPIASMI